MTALKLDPTTLISAKSTAGTNKSLANAALSYDDAKKVGSKATLDQAAKSFEAMFVQTMLKEMHNAKLDDGLFQSEDEKPFQSMLDSAYAELMSKNMRLGLADSISRQLSPTIGKGAKK